MIALWERLDGPSRFVAVATLAALVVLVPGVPTPLRAVAATAFFLVAPGLAWVHLLPVDGPVEQGAVAVALSLALDVLVAEALMFLGLPGPVPAAIVLAAVAAGGVAVRLRTPAEVAA
jgi:hypothetical protein